MPFIVGDDLLTLGFVGAAQEQKGPGLITNVEVSLADLYTGRTLEVRSP